MDTTKHENDVHIHHSSGHNPKGHTSGGDSSSVKLAISATIHCLIGCGLGEVLGMMISSSLHLENLASIIISVILGFFGGFILGIVPLRRKGFTFRNAFKTVLVGEGLSILVMETFEIITQTAIPGVMEAYLTESLFWIGMILSLFAGFIAALPVN